MTDSLGVNVDPRDLGFDPDRLARIPRHFDAHVANRRLAGYLTVVSRGGEVVHLSSGGHRDIEAGLPVTLDTKWRIYSMTKPITSVAFMMLVEEGRIGLNDPIAQYLPAFSEPRVYASGPSTAPDTVPSREPIRVWHLLTHTSGLTYGFNFAHPVDAMYRDAGLSWGVSNRHDLASICDAWAALPLVFEPGTAFSYSVSTDVLGRLIEVLTGEPLDQVLAERVLGPLGMNETTFFCDPDDDSLAMLYLPGPDGPLAAPDATRAYTRPPKVISGGGGLVSTAADYERFCQMILRGGALDGTRLLGPRTVDLMTTNHLPDATDLASFATDKYRETAYAGHGFGLGFCVVDDPIPARYPTSPGTAYWGGAASTIFWIDPVEDLTVAFYTQLMPSGTLPLRQELAHLVMASLVD
jgi:CubicO group peptidase (beta-lactamase class C family)